MSIHYPKRLIFPLLTFAATISQAEVVPADNARDLAAEFFSASKTERLASAESLELAYTGGRLRHPRIGLFPRGTLQCSLRTSGNELDDAWS